MTSLFLYSASLYEFSHFNSDKNQHDNQPNWLPKHTEMSAIIQMQLKELLHLAGHIFIDYRVPNSKVGADIVFLYRGLVFVVVFKSGESDYQQEDIESAHALALALKALHRPCHDRFIVPVVISTSASPQGSEIQVSSDGVFNTMMDSGENLAALLEHFANQFKADEIDVKAWTQNH